MPAEPSSCSARVSVLPLPSASAALTSWLTRFDTKLAMPPALPDAVPETVVDERLPVGVGTEAFGENPPPDPYAIKGTLVRLVWLLCGLGSCCTPCALGLPKTGRAVEPPAFSTSSRKPKEISTACLLPGPPFAWPRRPALACWRSVDAASSHAASAAGDGPEGLASLQGRVKVWAKAHAFC